MKLENAKLEDQHFVVTKAQVSLRFENVDEMIKYVKECKEECGCFMVITYNVTDAIKSNISV